MDITVDRVLLRQSPYDVIIIGAGAAGLMCALEAGARGRKVLILEKSNKVGKKILMSGGGRCNFTNRQVSPSHFISHNKHFCKSALSRYTPSDFIAMVERHHIAYFEKTLGQLFCEDKSSRIVDMLMTECVKNKVTIKLHQTVNSIKKVNDCFLVQSNQELYESQSLVIATGGLSIPSLGSSSFGYKIAEQFGLKVYPLRAGLVPFTLHTQDKERFEGLSGISVESLIRCNQGSFQENVLFTHRGLSGPAILQISSYWFPGDDVSITFLPEIDLSNEIQKAKRDFPNSHLRTVLSNYLPKRLLNVFCDVTSLDKPLKQLSHKDILSNVNALQHWTIKPNATEGYRTAEVTLGGVDCDELCSKHFEAKRVSGLFFIGEVVDVTGWLGGYNFQWAWSSGWSAGQVV